MARKDIYEMRPNFVITFPEDDTERMVDVLRSIYGFKEKGTHSVYTTDVVQYWYVENFGVVRGFLWDNECQKYGDGRKRGRTWSVLIRKLETSGIHYKIEVY